jgi:hypothetical protein
MEHVARASLNPRQPLLIQCINIESYFKRDWQTIDRLAGQVGTHDSHSLLSAKNRDRGSDHACVHRTITVQAEGAASPHYYDIGLGFSVYLSSPGTIEPHREEGDESTISIPMLEGLFLLYCGVKRVYRRCAATGVVHVGSESVTHVCTYHCW